MLVPQLASIWCVHASLPQESRARRTANLDALYEVFVSMFLTVASIYASWLLVDLRGAGQGDLYITRNPCAEGKHPHLRICLFRRR